MKCYYHPHVIDAWTKVLRSHNYFQVHSTSKQQNWKQTQIHIILSSAAKLPVLLPSGGKHSRTVLVHTAEMEWPQKAGTFLREIVQCSCPSRSLSIRVVELETEKRGQSREEALIKCFFIKCVVPLVKTTMVRSNYKASLTYILADLRQIHTSDGNQQDQQFKTEE